MYGHRQRSPQVSGLQKLALGPTTSRPASKLQAHGDERLIYCPVRMWVLIDAETGALVFRVLRCLRQPNLAPYSPSARVTQPPCLECMVHFFRLRHHRQQAPAFFFNQLCLRRRPCPIPDRFCHPRVALTSLPPPAGEVSTPTPHYHCRMNLVSIRCRYSRTEDRPRSVL